MAALEYWVEWVVLGYLLLVVSFFLFLLADNCRNYEMSSTWEQEHAWTPSKHVHRMKIMMKSQRNVLLIASALHLYWILFCIIGLLVRLINQLCNQRIEKLKRS